MTVVIVMKTIHCFFSFVIIICLLGSINAGYAQQGSVIVPNVEGIRQEVAAQLLRIAGLQPKMQGSIDPSAVVVDQEPRPGVSLPAGSQVALIAGTVLQTTESSRTLQISSSDFSGTSGITSLASGGAIITLGSGVTVMPLDTSSQLTSRSIVSSQSAQYGAYSQIQRMPVTPYFLADTRLKRYPVWYPRNHLPQAFPQDSQGTVQVRNTGQIQTFSDEDQMMSNVAPHWYGGWYYPQAWTSQRRAAITGSGTTIQSTSSTIQNVQTVQIHTQQSSTGVLPVPNLMRLREADAVAAIQKAGLAVGTVTRSQDSQWPSGLVMQQSPRARAIVQAGTKVHLWVTE